MATSRIATQEQFNEIRYQTLGDDTYANGIVVLDNRYVESRDWMTVHELVWSENNGRDIFSYYYEEAATAYQEGEEAEFDPSQIFEAVAEQVIVTTYTRVYPKKGRK